MRYSRNSLPTAALLLLSATSAAALPTGFDVSWLFGSQPSSQNAPLPASTLPAPTTPLKVIALGLGVQNYTCASPAATPVAIGALANLYDITTLVQSSGPWQSRVEESTTCFADHQDTAGVAPQIGRHFFDAGGVPNFDLYGPGLYLAATKVAAMPAPSPTSPCSIGRNGAAPVAWLNLAKDASGRSSGLSAVYRMETTGGSAASCAGTTQPGQVISSDYAAEYFFYQ